MLKYAAANMDSELPELNKAIQLTHLPTYSVKQGSIGLAWGIPHADKHEWFEHSGQTNGFQSYLVIDPKSKAAIVVLSNKASEDDDVTSDLGNTILELVEKK